MLLRGIEGAAPYNYFGWRGGLGDGDCHVASLLAMTRLWQEIFLALYGFLCYSYPINKKDKE